MTSRKSTQSKASGPGATRLSALIVDDEPPLVELVGSYLEREGFDVTSSGDGDSAVRLAAELKPDVIVLDLMLPGIDGIEACRQIRTFSDAYIIMLTARTEEIDKLIGLSVGADDYMTKPFSPRELVARIRALLRRPRADSKTVAQKRRFGDLTIDPAAREVSKDDVAIELTRLEFDIIDALSASPQVAFTRAQLIERVWGEDWFGDDHVVDVHIANLRRKLDDDPTDARYIRTVRGVGYRMGTGERPEK